MYLYDYWTWEDWHTQEPQTEAEAMTKDYRKWLEKTYNCKIVNVHKGDWSTLQFFR